MNEMIGTAQCPHLGFDLQGGRPCCHADDGTRMACGKFAPNPAARGAGSSEQISGVEAYFCTVLGTDTLPPEALRLAAQEKARARKQETESGPRYRAPQSATGQTPPRPDRARQPEGDADPVIPTHTLRNEGRQVQPNDKCPCNSGRKFKKCCGNR
jgi:hypothetical protein